MWTSPLAEQLSEGLLERLVRYCRIDTQSDRESGVRPSTPGQWDLLRLLEAELRELGLEDVGLDEGANLIATLPGTEPDAPVLGLLAHVDTSPDAPGAGVEPIVHRDYDGGVVELPRGGTRLDPAAMPALGRCVGHTIVTSSGDTLLGADDKAGVAEVMTVVAWLAAHPELPRPTIRVGFTPDEEIGLGAGEFPLERFAAHGAYTFDGSDLGELQTETFTAAEAVVAVRGVDVHPGWAKGTLVNALRVCAQVVAALPADRLTPETTSGREGFLHPYELTGTSGLAEARFIVRDFDEDRLAEHVALLRETADRVAAATPGATSTVEVRPQYPNMRDHLAPFPEVVEAAEAALRAEGLEPVRTPIRGGTDGSILSARGLPTPNLFTGGHEYHSTREWASLPEMAAAAAVGVHLAGAWAQLRV